VSFQSTSGSNLPRLLAHELTHLATREIVGTDAVVPAWLEEGLAAEIEAGDAGIDKDSQLAARSLIANAPRTLDTITTLADWHREYAKLGTALYAVSAETVGAIETTIGRDGMFSLLAEVGRGASFADAYRARSGESLDEFVARFTTALALRASVTVGTVPDSSGNLPWTLTGFAPNSDVRITISGKSYDLGYSVRTDGIGMYRGTFGSTATAGSYTLTAKSTSFHVTGIIDTASP